MPQAAITIPGDPKAKMRPKFVRGSKVAYTPTATMDAQTEIGQLWIWKRRSRVPDGQSFALKIEAIFARPKTHLYKAGGVKPRYEDALPGPLLDLDNIAKLAMDGLNGVAYQDDRFCTALMVTKEWAPLHQPAGELRIMVIWSDIPPVCEE